MKNLSIILLCLTVILFSCGTEKDTKSDVQVVKKKEIKKKTPKLYNEKPARFNTIPGKWILMYPNKYGYSLYFSKNCKSVIILYLKSYALVFKGVYTFENNSLKINVYEMKNSSRTSYINLYRNFTKVKSSQFIFKSKIRTRIKTKRKQLILQPIRITIDGNTSDGYFEPVIKLNKIR